MKKISSRTVAQTTLDTAGAWTPPTLDAATVDFYLRRGRQERARAFADMIRSVFSSPATRPAAEVVEMPARRAAPAPRSEGSRAA